MYSLLQQLKANIIIQGIIKSGITINHIKIIKDGYILKRGNGATVFLNGADNIIKIIIDKKVKL